MRGAFYFVRGILIVNTVRKDVSNHIDTPWPYQIGKLFIRCEPNVVDFLFSV